MPKVLVVGVGGFLGAVARYLLSGFIHSVLGDDFPSGTIVANIIGCFLLGGIMFMRVPE